MDDFQGNDWRTDRHRVTAGGSRAAIGVGESGRGNPSPANHIGWKSRLKTREHSREAGNNERTAQPRRFAPLASRRAYGLAAAIAGSSIVCCESASATGCAGDVATPNIDRINAALDKMDGSMRSVSERVHDIQSKVQSEALWAYVAFLREDKWSLAVLSSDGMVVHQWGQIDPECARPCLDGAADNPAGTQCRSVPVGSTGYILCGSRDDTTTPPIEARHVFTP